MTRRDRFFRALRREGSGEVPLQLDLCPDQLARFVSRHHLSAPHELPESGVCDISPRFTGDRERFAAYHDLTTANLHIGAFGIGYLYGKSLHFSEKVHPMRGLSTPDEFHCYPYPDADADFDWDAFAKDVAMAKAADCIAIGKLTQTLFETAWQMRGMEALLVDLALDEPVAAILLDRLTAVRLRMAERMTVAGVDVLWVGDDVATQRGMMFAADQWRQWFAPRIRAIIEAARAMRPGLPVAYHGCGNMTDILPDLLELGVDLLHPVQPECMDVFELKRRYGDRLSFWGGVGTQRLLPRGTPGEIRAATAELLTRLGKGGGFIIAPAHVVEPEVPDANIDALIDAVKTHNTHATQH